MSHFVLKSIIFQVRLGTEESEELRIKRRFFAAYTAMEKALYVGGFDALATLNRKEWSDIWKGRITFTGSGFTADDQVRKNVFSGLRDSYSKRSF